MKLCCGYLWWNRSLILRGKLIRVMNEPVTIRNKPIKVVNKPQTQHIIHLNVLKNSDFTKSDKR